MAGAVRRLDGERVLSLEAYDTRSGRAPGARQLFSGRVRDLIEELRQ